MGLEFIKPDTNFHFLGYRKYAYILSAVVILAGVVSLFMKGGPAFGVDFAGGITIQLKFTKHVTPEEIRSSLDRAGLEHLAVQRLGAEKDNAFQVNAPEKDESVDQVRTQVDTALKAGFGEGTFEVQKLDAVGPKVGADLKAGALNAIFVAVLLISIYISGRFEQRWLVSIIMAAALWGGTLILREFGLSTGWLIFGALIITLAFCWVLKLKFALGAVVADIHDIAITVGIFSIFGLEFDLTVLAALLTLLGYSLNDTIIVYDRIRERLHHTKGEPLEQVINAAINQTLSRTLLTSFITFFMVTVLYFFGGSALHEFSLAMMIGVVTGTYSSIFVASPILLDFGGGLEALRDQPVTANAAKAVQGGKA